MEQPAKNARRRAWRAHVTAEVAHGQDGVVSRAQLRGLGVTRWDLREEVAAGRWSMAGSQSVVLRPGGDLAERWRAIFEVGSGARLDGVTALLHAGLSGWEHTTIDVSVPHGTRVRRIDGVTIHALSRLEPSVSAGLPRARPAPAALRAASWARSERQAATLIAMTAQQRLASRSQLLAAWEALGRCRRRSFIGTVVRDVCAGAQSLGELDFAALCRRYRLPTPERQVVVEAAGSRYYLDVRWRDHSLVVEVDGAHHTLGMSVVDDALRQNVVMLGGDRVLRIPVLGLRVQEAEFMAQVAAGLGMDARRVA
ncbi:hypothetical protein [Luteipulveratus halotolerans]|uniref:DUF559 domain-containing protein n=1 Tax=Luteipulveratus halotolerans TaxID=1631356 RepID=A0A0L6CEG4_9MICO|nr:hypothetical protein [Luteipulveratus halotolerans]KNX36069.1 hypothetical protein VV01_01135 [Luteipulveratus halotolerans]